MNSATNTALNTDALQQTLLAGGRWLVAHWARKSEEHFASIHKVAVGDRLGRGPLYY